MSSRAAWLDQSGIFEYSGKSRGAKHPLDVTSSQRSVSTSNMFECGQLMATAWRLRSSLTVVVTVSLVAMNDELSSGASLP